jgi:glycerol-3-phosphate dehydrogenase
MITKKYVHERRDIGSGASSRSSKLIQGGYVISIPVEAELMRYRAVVESEGLEETTSSAKATDRRSISSAS